MTVYIFLHYDLNREEFQLNTLCRLVLHDLGRFVAAEWITYSGCLVEGWSMARSSRGQRD